MTAKSESAHLTQAPSDSSSRDGDRLDTWKEIAAYLRREVRTVQLWEKNEGLPVHRHFHKRLGSVFALRSEIDEWKQQVSRTPRGREIPGKSRTTRNRFTTHSLPWDSAVIKGAAAIGQHAKSSSREEYLRGRYFWNQRHETGLRKAIACFESVMREDPEFALPYSGLADSLTLLSFYEIVPPSEVMPAARKAARKAIELDPNSAEAHTSLADVFLHFDRDWQSADREYRLAIQCDPDYALGYHWYANLLSARGQHEAARMAIMHALDINPVSIITLVWAGVTSHLAHRFDEAIRHYQNALELDSSFIWAHTFLAQSLEQKGDFQAALQEFETATRLSGGENHCVKAMMAHAYAVAGESATAREILQEVSGASPRSMPSYEIAATYAALGESRPTIDWLNRACQERNMKLFALTQDPRFDSLRHSSGFKQVLARVGLAEYNTTLS